MFVKPLHESGIVYRLTGELADSTYDLYITSRVLPSETGSKYLITIYNGNAFPEQEFVQQYDKSQIDILELYVFTPDKHFAPIRVQGVLKDGFLLNRYMYPGDQYQFSATFFDYGLVGTNMQIDTERVFHKNLSWTYDGQMYDAIEFHEKTHIRISTIGQQHPTTIDSKVSTIFAKKLGIVQMKTHFSNGTILTLELRAIYAYDDFQDWIRGGDEQSQIEQL